MYRYSTFDVLALRGPDALSFAQSQLASDVAAIPDGSWRWSAYLSPQGRAIAVMPVARHASDALDLLVPAARGAEIAARLQRFVFRTRVTVAVLAGFEAHARPRDDEPAGVIVGQPGTYRVALDESFAIITGDSAPDDFEARWRAHLVDTGIALLAGAAVEAHTGHALALDALDAISTRKGCYPGQEIVARMHFLGRNKRHLCRYTASVGSPEPAPGVAIVNGDGTAVAEIVLSTVAADGTLRGLAVAHEQALVGGAAFRLGGDAVSLVRVR